MENESRSGASRGFYFLNALRVCSVVSLVSSIVAASATLIKSFTASKFFFFDASGHAILSALCIFLIMSEYSLAPGYYSKNWPVFCKDASLAWQGIAEVAVGICLLGNLNEDFASKKILGTPFNTLLVASGVLVIVMGICTFVASFVFRNGKTTARMARSIRRHRQFRGSRPTEVPRPFMNISAPMHPDINLPERSYSFRSHQESDDSYYKSFPSGGRARSDTSSRYSGDAELNAERYQNELRLPV